MSFTPDEKIQQIAEAYALDACDFLKQHFGIALDWTDSSIEHIESITEMFHADLNKSKPSDEQVMGFAKMFGSYVGEVYRKNHGATWGWVEMDGHRFPGLKTAESGITFWPWGRAHNRLVDGGENNISHYYQELIRRS